MKPVNNKKTGTPAELTTDGPTLDFVARVAKLLESDPENTIRELSYIDTGKPVTPPKLKTNKKPPGGGTPPVPSM